MKNGAYLLYMLYIEISIPENPREIKSIPEKVVFLRSAGKKQVEIA